MFEAKAGYEEQDIYKDSFESWGKRNVAVTASGENINAMALTLMAHAILRQVQNEFGSEFVVYGSLLGSVQMGEAGVASDIDMHVVFRNIPQLLNEADQVRNRFYELEQVLMSELRANRVGQDNIARDRLLHAMAVITDGPGNRNLIATTQRRIVRWLSHDQRPVVQALLHEYLEEAFDSSEQTLVEFRSQSGVEEGMLFSLRAPPEGISEIVLTGDFTNWVQNENDGALTLTHIRDDLWAVVVPANIVPARNNPYESVDTDFALVALSFHLQEYQVIAF